MRTSNFCPSCGWRICRCPSSLRSRNNGSSDNYSSAHVKPSTRETAVLVSHLPRDCQERLSADLGSLVCVRDLKSPHVHSFISWSRLYPSVSRCLLVAASFREFFLFVLFQSLTNLLPSFSLLTVCFSCCASFPHFFSSSLSFNIHGLEAAKFQLPPHVTSYASLSPGLVTPSKTFL